jgi:hypothetical protein
MDNVPLGADQLLSVVYRKSRDRYLCNCEATASRGERYSKSIAIIVTPAVPSLSKKFDTRRSAKFLDDWMIRLVSVTCRCLPHGA